MLRNKKSVKLQPRMPAQLTISKPTAEEFISIQQYIQQFELDNRSLEQEQFLVANQQHQIMGFGRIREYNGSSELCSLGVIEPERNKGIGKILTQQLIQKAKQPLFLVCIIPDFFRPFGFKETADFPEELNNKLQYCVSELAVQETYVVMKHQPSI